MTNEHIFIGAKAPDFTADSTFGEISLSDFSNNWIVLFSYSGDFMPVCTSEFVAFSKKAQDFAERNTQLLAVGTDSNSSHFAWIHAIKMTTGVEVSFPVMSDKSGQITKMYNMFSNDSFIPERNVYIIDGNRNIRAIMSYPTSSGRNVDEILRLLSSIQISDAENMLTPVNWKCGDAPIYPVPKTYKELVINENDCENCRENWYSETNI